MNKSDMENLMRGFVQKDSDGNEVGGGTGFGGGKRELPARPDGLLDKIDSAMSEIEAARYKEQEAEKIQTQTSTREVAYYRCKLCGKQRQSSGSVCSPEAIYA